MKKAVNYIRGSVRVAVDCPYPERLINVCAQNDIEFWDMERVSGTTVHISMHRGGYIRLGGLAAGAGFTIGQVKKKGVPYFLWRLRRRYVLLGGMVLMFLAVWSLSFFIWEMEVHGNEEVPTQRILEALRELGVEIGAFGLSINSEALANDVILEIPELSWIAVNVRGSHADVLVRERVPRPEILDENAPTMVWAVKPGIITRMSVLKGAHACAEGDTVQAGDILVTGVMESLASGRRLEHAMAEVTARTWYELSAQLPLDTLRKTYTGREKAKTAVVIAGKRVNLYFSGGISYDRYDKITTEKAIRLPTGNVLPLTVVTERYAEYDVSGAQLTVAAAQDILEERLFDRLWRQIEDGEILHTALETSTENGVVTVTLRAECSEQIAAERPFTEDERTQAALPPP